MLWILVLLASMVILAACGGGAPQTGSDAEPPEHGEEKVITLGRSWEEKSWDPAALTMPDDIYLAPMIYENLVELNIDGSLSPELAEDWEVSEDGLTYTFNLRQGVKWHHDYGEFTSEDVKFSIERHGDPDVGSINLENIHLDNIESIDTPDDYTVVIKLKSIDVDFMTRLALYYGNMVSKAAYEDKGIDGMKLFPVGTGAYQYDKGTPGTKTEVVRFNDWWGEAAGNVDRIIAHIITDTNTMYSALENGEIDTFDSYDKDKTKEFISKGFTSDSVPYRQLLYVGLNMQLEPFDNPKVREAFFHAIDPDVFIKDLYYETETAAGSYIPAESKYGLKDHFQPSYDPEKAKQLLAEAGYADGLEVTLWSINDGISPAPATITQSQLQDAGFKCEMQLVEAGVFFDKVREGEAGMWLLYNDTPAIADHTMTRYTSVNYPGNNWCGIMDKEYDALVDAGMKASTEEEKAAKFADAQKRLMSLNVLYPVATYHFDHISNSRLTGHIICGDGIVRYHNAVLE